MKRIQIDAGIIGYKTTLIFIDYFDSMDTLPSIINDYLKNVIPVNLNNIPRL